MRMAFILVVSFCMATMLVSCLFVGRISWQFTGARQSRETTCVLGSPECADRAPRKTRDAVGGFPTPPGPLRRPMQFYDLIFRMHK